MENEAYSAVQTERSLRAKDLGKDGMSHNRPD
jgi:hypothetical protein